MPKTMKNKDLSSLPDYYYDWNASQKLLSTLKAYYAGSLRPPKFWIEESFVMYGGKMRKTYSVKSSIVMRVPK